MKKYIALAIGLLPLAAFSQKKFTVTGQTGIKVVPEMVYLASDFHVKDSTSVKNGMFTFNGITTDPQVITLILRYKADAKIPTEKLTDYFSLWIENGNIDVVASDSIKYAKVSGTKINLESNELTAMQKPYNDSIVRILAPVKAYLAKLPPMSMEKLNQAENQPWIKILQTKAAPFQQKARDIDTRYYRTHPNSYIALKIFSERVLFRQIPADSAQVEFDRFSPAIKATELGQALLKSFKKRDEGLLKIGNPPPAFTHADVNGKEISLSSFKGKYVLVDFWASWCYPCRGENPNVVKAYKALHDKGLEIISVSLDDNLLAWKAAIEKDGLPWTQICDKAGKEGIAINYNVSSIPMNFLIAPDGKLLSQNLRGEDLDEKLAKLMKIK